MSKSADIVLGMGKSSKYGRRKQDMMIKMMKMMKKIKDKTRFSSDGHSEAGGHQGSRKIKSVKSELHPN